MSAILSADDLNDFISPGVACIKPIETLPLKDTSSNPYEVTTEDQLAASNPPPAQISLTDCLACSGCVTSAEAVLVSLQSHTEVLSVLDAHPSWRLPNQTSSGAAQDAANADNSRIFVASVSPQARASLAAVYGITEHQAGGLIEQLLIGPHGLKSGGLHNSAFAWVVDTNVVRDAALVLAADEVLNPSSTPPERSVTADHTVAPPRKPILTSACPGWICYAEKTHPYVLPHLSRLKSPQALSGTLLKSVLCEKYQLAPDRIWHLAIMPCFDKKLEASRTELTSASWYQNGSSSDTPTRDIDCVITARELVHLASARGINLPNLPRTSVSQAAFPDPVLSSFIFPKSPRRLPQRAAGSSGGYLHHIITTAAAQRPGTEVQVERGRNADVIEYKLVHTASQTVVLKMAKYYGFRNIQNLVRKLKPKAASRMPGAVKRGPGAKNGPDNAGIDFKYVEVMACPGGCTNGGGQVKVGEVEQLRGNSKQANASNEKYTPQDQKAWLARVDEAYFSAESSDEDTDPMDVDSSVTTLPHETMRDCDNEPYIDVVDGISHVRIHSILDHWAATTGIDKERLFYTTFREVESDVGKGKSKSKSKRSDMDRVIGLASSAGGGW